MLKRPRLVFYVFVHSNQESIMTSGTTPLSYFELTLPLPVTRKVWTAPSDAAWAEEAALSTHGNDAQHASLSITDCLADLSRLSRLSDAYDQTLSRLLLLYALAPMIQSYRHLHMAPTWGCSGEDDVPSAGGDHFSDNMHYHWLLRPFENLKNVFELYDPDDAPSSSPAVLMEALHLHLHTPVDHLELLAGGAAATGLREARESFALVRRWAGSRMARRSAWYAGQVLGKLRDLAPAAMTEFHCVIIYQALLCLWAYGAIVGSDTELGTVHGAALSAAEEIEVALDSTESPVTKKWIIFGRGCPVMTTMRDIAESESLVSCPISSRLVLATHCMNLIRSKLCHRSVLPPTAENISIKIRNLGNTRPGDFLDQ